jgi:MoxR-like ATPase
MIMLGLSRWTLRSPTDFALFIEAADWQGLSNEARSYIAQPGGEGRIANDSGALKARIEEWREEFLRKVDRCPVGIVRYAVAATSALNSAGVRISPRRARLVARSLLAASIAAGGMRETVCRQVLRASIPQACWGVKVSAEVIAAAHRAAWESASDKGPRWIHRFHAEHRLARKLEILLAECRSPDDGTQAIAQFIASESRERAAAFSFAIYPAAAMGKLPIGPTILRGLQWHSYPLKVTFPGKKGYPRLARSIPSIRGARWWSKS